MSATTETLPTLSTLGLQEAPAAAQVQAPAIAASWLKQFASNINEGNVDGIVAQFIPDSFWRDALALTWDFRTFHGQSEIRTFATERLSQVKVTDVSLQSGPHLDAIYQTPFPDIAWIQAFFTFSTEIGLASGVLRLVPLPSGEWKAHTIFTKLEGIKGHPEQIGALRNQLPDHGLWIEKRRRELEFEDGDPTVIVIGGGQSGLDIGARLKALGLSTLILEKNPRVGDQWRNRYEALCLHDPVWYDHMPYLPFPSTWPVYCPAQKLADWLESYAHALELNVWTSAPVSSAKYDESKQLWTVTLSRAGKTRTLTAKHVVFALGIGGGDWKIPPIPNQEDFKGKIVHSMKHTTAKGWEGKKALVVGACTSGHDIAHDFYNHGVDVTMFQRSSTYIMSTKNGFKVLFEGTYEESGPPTEIADRIIGSFPNRLTKLMHQRATKYIAQLDDQILQDLKKVGFRTNFGEDDSGFLFLALKRAGGYYLDVGASRLIADKKIKLKNDTQIKKFTKTGVEFENGSTLDADIVVFATGLGDSRYAIRQIVEPEVGAKLKPIWGIDGEGEVQSTWRGSGVDRLWVMMGNLAMCRDWSKAVALRTCPRLRLRRILRS
ncbi:FAD/NAD(P)-binding domain-containing protein [Sistotremastrum suecicum HHB10207 ss-3]|uniref:FAD/NAD(P)-binding domain-containing protein n=1 Tax=Sistotremastrum suecicum HHB10207 ss-3 TaxID=1314776 RepID=A0A166F0G6_9AGAM|nr:FAD/NAD(P)-binding domain-containing protein [Sistotremastrum suecicum HHB10207 ss-3]